MKYLKGKFSALSSLLFTGKCPACGKQNSGQVLRSEICIKCEEFLKINSINVYRGSLRIFAGSKYSLPMSHLIIAAKEDNQLHSRKFLAKRLLISLEVAVKELANHPFDKSVEVILIPIPSRRAADRKRGFAHIELLLKLLVFEANSIDLRIVDCLEHAKKIVDQSTLNFNERELNMRGAFSVKMRFSNEISRIKSNQIRTDNPRDLKTLVFLVDDLVTTGTTVQAANAALNSLGLRVDGTLASCATDGFTH